MSVTCEKKDDVTVIHLDGDLLHRRAGEFRRVVQECLDRDRRDLVIDLSGTERIDSEGLEALTWTLCSCEEKLGICRLAGANETCAKVFEMTRLNGQFHVCKTLEQALESFV